MEAKPVTYQVVNVYFCFNVRHFNTGEYGASLL